MPSITKESYRLLVVQRALGNRYTIIKKIATGGFGSVYLGEHSQLGRKIAIKVLLKSLAEDREVVQRFERESRAVAGLSHPNIIDIYDVGESESELEEAHVYYFVMKYVEGETLAQKMQREEKIPPSEAIHIVKQLADALSYAHEHAVVHRDIKPSNVMLDEYGTPILMDFGVAHLQFEGDLTQKGALMGTPHYLAPEQPLGKSIDGRSDIYSLGIMFYEMLAGHPPFHDKSSVSLIFKHINEPPFPLKELDPELSSRLCSIVHKMIEKEPADRYQSASDIVEELETLSEVYPPVVVAPRRGTSAMMINTEKLMQMGADHFQHGKYEEAIEICFALAQRGIHEDSAKQKLEELVEQLLEIISNLISDQSFLKARFLLRQAELLTDQEDRVKKLRMDLEHEELLQLKHSELKDCYDTLEMALEHEDATQAIEYLTKAMVLDPDNQQMKPLYSRTEKLILTQIDQLCEKLDFLAAKELLDDAKGPLSDSIGRREEAIERNRVLYEKFLRAKSLFRKDMMKEAVREYRDLLETPSIYDVQLFSGLRKEAEDTIRMAELKPTPPDLERIERPVETAPIASQKARSFPLQPVLFLILGSVVIAGVVFVFRNRHANPPASVQVPVKPAVLPTPPVPRPIATTENRPVAVESVPVPVKPEPPKPIAFGTMIIQSRPPGALIRIGSKSAGMTPKTFTNTTAGKYKITLSKEGYNKYSTSVVVHEEQTSIITADLATIPSAPTQITKPREAQPIPGMAVTLGPDVVAPKPIKRTRLQIPDGVDKVQGTIRLNMLVDETGTVVAVRIVQSVDPRLDAAAVKCVKEWKYQPGQKKGVQVSVWVPVSFEFVK